MFDRTGAEKLAWNLEPSVAVEAGALVLSPPTFESLET